MALCRRICLDKRKAPPRWGFNKTLSYADVSAWQAVVWGSRY